METARSVRGIVDGYQEPSFRAAIGVLVAMIGAIVLIYLTISWFMPAGCVPSPTEVGVTACPAASPEP